MSVTGCTILKATRVLVITQHTAVPSTHKQKPWRNSLNSYLFGETERSEGDSFLILLKGVFAQGMCISEVPNTLMLVRAVRQLVAVVLVTLTCCFST